MTALHPYVLPFLFILGSLIVGVFGRHRKWGFWGYFWASMLMSPVLGLLFVLAGDAPPKRRFRSEARPESKLDQRPSAAAGPTKVAKPDPTQQTAPAPASKPAQSGEASSATSPATLATPLAEPVPPPTQAQPQSPASPVTPANP